MEPNGLSGWWLFFPGLLYVAAVTSLARLGVLPPQWPQQAAVGAALMCPGLYWLWEAVRHRQQH